MAKDYSTIVKYYDSIVLDKSHKYIFIEMNNPKPEYMTELHICFGEKRYIINNPGDTWFFNIPSEEWLNEIPNSYIGTGTIELQTWDMFANTGEPLYSDVKKFTVYVSEEFKPEVSNLSVVVRDTSRAVVDYAIYGLTYPEFRALVTPCSSSPIKKWYITGGGIDVSGDFSYLSGYEDYNFWTIGTVFRTWSNTKLTLTVEDGRGRRASITSDEIYVQSYNRPLINSLSAYRTDKDGIAKADGGYIKVNVNAASYPIKNSEEVDVNTLECYVDWKEVNGSYSHFTKITNQEPYIFEADIDLNFEIKCEVRDKYMQTVAYCSVLGDSKDFNIVDGGGGAAVGTKATKGYFDVAYNSRFQKGVNANEEISSNKGLISTGTGSKGDFLSFGEAERISSFTTPGGGTYWGDLNEYTNIGVYGIYYDKDVSLSEYVRVYNAPCEKAGTLRVYNATGNMTEWATEMYLMQEYVVRDGSAIYRRGLSKIRDNSDVEWPEDWTFGNWYCYSGTLI